MASSSAWLPLPSLQLMTCIVIFRLLSVLLQQKRHERKDGFDFETVSTAKRCGDRGLW
jgi:hypothetical protein